MIRPQIGDTVKISQKHPGFAKGHVGKVWSYTTDGRAIVKIRGGFRARVRIVNLEPILDSFEKEAERGEDNRH